MDYFQNVAGHLGEFQALSKHIGKPTPLPLMVTGLSHIHKAHFLAALVQNGSVSAENRSWYYVMLSRYAVVFVLI